MKKHLIGKTTNRPLGVKRAKGPNEFLKANLCPLCKGRPMMVNLYGYGCNYFVCPNCYKTRWELKIAVYFVRDTIQYWNRVTSTIAAELAVQERFSKTRN